MSLLDHQLIITVNRRLARELTCRYSDDQKATGKRVWESPSILPWSSWLNSLWRQKIDQNARHTEMLLSDQQSRVVWEGIIRYSPMADGLLQVSETTRVVMEAWRLLHDHALNLDDITTRQLDQSPDIQVFCEWAKAYRDRLSYKRWIDQAMLTAELITGFKMDQQLIPESLMLAGFDELSPVQQNLINQLIAKGCLVESYKTESTDTSAVRIACADADHEVHLAAGRARNLLEQNTVSRIGVIVPDLHRRKAQILGIFEDTLIPEAVLPGSNLSKPFNVSLGDPLTSFPMIRTALLILKAVTDRLLLEELSRLIRSPFIAGSETEMNQRCWLDARLREYGDDSLSMPFVIKEASVNEVVACPILAQILRDTRTLVKDKFTRKRTIAEWIMLFNKVLESMGWPGERPLSSEEKQTRDAWHSACDKGVTLETVTHEMSSNTALSHVQKIVRQQTFQPETEEVPIQIMGVLEAAELQFDHVLVLGMTDDQWPAKPSPNPFLPLHIQREKKMPHATAEWELNFANSMIDGILRSAPDITFSFPQQAADQELRPSPLIKPLPEISEQDYVFNQGFSQSPVIPVTLETLEDNQASPLPENVIWQGGVGIFKDQAACPFRAFVSHRLNAQPLGVAEPGLNPAQRGSLVHVALENLWERLESQEKLLRLSPDQIRQEIHEAVEYALQEFHSGKSVVQEEHFRKLELDRLEQLLAEWLEIERKRDPFTVIAREQDMMVTLGGISVKTRVDRIDQLAGEKLALIDYKTGDVKTKYWDGDRPEEPQLPLYAISMQPAPEAVLFAKVKKGDQQLIGLSAVEGVVKETCEDWELLIANWREALENLATQFVQGLAIVDPKENNTCQYCTYHSVCRIDELVEFGGRVREQEDD